MIKKILIWGVCGLLLLVAGMFLFLRTPDLPATELEAKYTNAASAFASLPSGARAHYRLYGDTDAIKLVLMHGSNASLHTWEPWVAELKDRFRILTIDLPGHGLTGPTRRDEYSPGAMADMVKELVTQLGWTNFALGGNSMGGTVTLTYTLKYPGDVSHLVLVDAGGVSPDAPVDAKKRSVPLAFKVAGTWYGDLIFTNILPRSLVTNGLEASTTVRSIITEEMIDRYHDLARYPGSRLATSKRFKGYRDAPRGDLAVADISQPTLIIWGRDDGLISVASGEKMARLMPDNRLEILEETGHLPMEERPIITAAMVAKFLTDK